MRVIHLNLLDARFRIEASLSRQNIYWIEFCLILCDQYLTHLSMRLVKVPSFLFVSVTEDYFLILQCNLLIFAFLVERLDQWVPCVKFLPKSWLFQLHDFYYKMTPIIWGHANKSDNWLNFFSSKKIMLLLVVIKEKVQTWNCFGPLNSGNFVQNWNLLFSFHIYSFARI